MVAVAASRPTGSAVKMPGADSRIASFTGALSPAAVSTVTPTSAALAASGQTKATSVDEANTTGRYLPLTRTLASERSRAPSGSNAVPLASHFPRRDARDPLVHTESVEPLAAF
jgi:hypothetical protein